MTDAIASAPAAQHATADTGAIAGARLREIDLLRGLVIALMALDHVRDYMHVSGWGLNPLDPAQTTPLLYATRWITHLCAPTFVFLAGVSAYLQFARGKATPNLSMFLLTRGLWLIFLEATVLSLGWSFAVPYLFFLQVIWAIGWSMIALAALVWLPRLAVLAIGVTIITGHNLLDPLSAQQFGSAGVLWTMLHDGGPIFVGQMPIALVSYPVLPWLGIMAAGYGAGALFLEPAATRDRKLIAIGLGMIALFLLLRGFNLYGNPAPVNQGGQFGAAPLWQDQETLGAQIMAFLNVQKYPPSLMFVLATLGVSSLLFVALSRLRGPLAQVLATFGAVPFFFYVLHIYLVHGLAVAANAAVGRDPSFLFGYFFTIFTAPQRMQGFDLPWIYPAWLLVLAVLYPLCRWWAGVKARERKWWMSYL